MKSVKVIIASLIAIALMVTPIALFAMDDTESEAANFDQLSDFIDDIDFQKLMSLDYSKASRADPETIATSVTVGPGEYMFLEKDYTFNDGVTITVQDGGALTICPTQTFSLASAGYGGFILEQGASIFITTDGNEPTPDYSLVPGNIILEIPIEESTAFYFTGKMGYTQNAYEFIAYADKGTVLADSNVVAEQTAKLEFPEDNNMTLKVVMAGTTSGKATVEVSVKSTLNAKFTATVEEEPATATTPAKTRNVISTLSGSTDYTVNAEMTTSETQADYKFSLKGDNELDVAIDDKYGGTVKDKADFTVTATVYKDSTKDPVTTMSGSLSLEISTKNMEDYEAAPGTTITVKDAKAKFSLDFKNDTVTGIMDVDIGTYELTVANEAGDDTMTFKNLSIYGKYGGLYSFEGLPTSSSSPLTPSSSTYYDGLVPGMSASEIKAYASDYYLGSFDKSYGLDKAGLTTTSIDVELSVGKADYNGFTVSGLSADLEINESVGLSASAKVDSIIIQPGAKLSSSSSSSSSSPSTTKTKIIIGSSSVNVNTDTKGKAAFVIEFSGSGEMKSYDGGFLASNIYGKDIKGKITYGKKTTIQSLSVGEVAMGSYGVYMKASNVSYDTDWEAFIIDEVSISGNYYGDALVKSVEGKYKEVVYDPSATSSSLSAKSADIRVYAMNNDYMDFTRSYDSEKKVIVNNYKVNGLMYMDDVLTDSALTSLLNVSISGVSPTTKQVNYFEGGALVSAGYTVGTELSVTTYPGITVNDNKTITVRNPTMTLTAPSQVYVTCSDVEGYIDHAKGAIDVKGVVSTVELTGAALGVSVDADGAVTYSLAALPGYKLSENMTYSGFTLVNCDEKSGEIKDLGATVTCTAIAKEFNIKLDGKTVNTAPVKYGSYVSLANVVTGYTLYIVDSNGREIGYVSDNDWIVGYYVYTDDIDAKSVTGKIVTEFADAGNINVIDDVSSIKFVVPAGQSAMKFSLSSKVRFDLSGLAADDDVELVAQPTKYDGRDAFIIKANGPYGMDTTLYIPVSGEGKRLMHVDDYGRTAEIQSQFVTIDGQNYLKATVSDYSIFYAETDDSPVLPSSGGSNWILYAAIGGVAAIVLIAGAVIFIKKR